MIVRRPAEEHWSAIAAHHDRHNAAKNRIRYNEIARSRRAPSSAGRRVLMVLLIALALGVLCKVSGL